MIDAKQCAAKILAEFRVGYPFRGAITPVASGSVAVVQMKDVSATDAPNWNAVVRTELPGRREPDWLRPGDILFVARGNRYHAVVLESVPSKSVCGPHLSHLRLKRDDAVLPAFLAWQINQPPIQRLLRRAAEGSNQLSIRRAEIEALPISVPSLVIQEQVLRMAQAAARERDLLNQLIINRERQLSAMAFALAEAADRSNTSNT